MTSDLPSNDELTTEVVTEWLKDVEPIAVSDELIDQIVADVTRSDDTVSHPSPDLDTAGIAARTGGWKMLLWTVIPAAVLAVIGYFSVPGAEASVLPTKLLPAAPDSIGPQGRVVEKDFRIVLSSLEITLDRPRGRVQYSEDELQKIVEAAYSLNRQRDHLEGTEKENVGRLLNCLGWFLATAWDQDGGTIVTGITFARTAEALLPKEEQYSAVDTQAAAMALAKDFKQAVDLQKKAIAMAPRGVVPQLKARLELYKQGKQFRRMSGRKNKWEQEIQREALGVEDR